MNTLVFKFTSQKLDITLPIIYLAKVDLTSDFNLSSFYPEHNCMHHTNCYTCHAIYLLFPSLSCYNLSILYFSYCTYPFSEKNISFENHVGRGVHNNTSNSRSYTIVTIIVPYVRYCISWVQLTKCEVKLLCN